MSFLVAQKLGLNLGRKSLLPEEEFFKNNSPFNEEDLANFEVKVNYFQNYKEGQLLQEQLEEINRRVTDLLINADFAAEVLPFETLGGESRWRGSFPIGGNYEERTREASKETKEAINDIVRVIEKSAKRRYKTLMEIMDWLTTTGTEGGFESATLFDKKMNQSEKNETKSFQEVMFSLKHRAETLKKLKSIGNNLFEGDPATTVSPRQSRLHSKTKAHLNEKVRKASRECDAVPQGNRADKMKHLFLPTKLPSDMDSLKANPDEVDEGEQKLLLEISNSWQEVGKEIRDIMISVHELKILKRSTRLSVRRALYLFKMIISLLGIRSSEIILKDNELQKCRMDLSGARSKEEHLHKEAKNWREKLNTVQNKNSKLSKEKKTLEITTDTLSEAVSKKDDIINDLQNRLTEMMLKTKKDVRVEEVKGTEDKGKVKRWKDASKKQNTRIDELQKQLKSLTKNQHETADKEKFAVFEAEERIKLYEESLKEAKKKVRLTQSIAQEYEADLKKKTEDLIEKDGELRTVLRDLRAKDDLIAALLNAPRTPDESKSSDTSGSRKGSIKSAKTKSSKTAKQTKTNTTSEKQHSISGSISTDPSFEDSSTDSIKKGSISLRSSSQSSLSKTFGSSLGSIIEQEESIIVSKTTPLKAYRSSHGSEDSYRSQTTDHFPQEHSDSLPLNDQVIESFQSVPQKEKSSKQSEPSREKSFHQPEQSKLSTTQVHQDQQEADKDVPPTLQQEQLHQSDQITQPEKIIQPEKITQPELTTQPEEITQLEQLTQTEQITQPDKLTQPEQIIKPEKIIQPEQITQTEAIPQEQIVAFSVVPKSPSPPPQVAVKDEESKKRHSIVPAAERRKSVDIITRPEYKRVVAELWKTEKEKCELEADLNELRLEVGTMKNYFEEEKKAIAKRQAIELISANDKSKQDLSIIYHEAIRVEPMMTKFKQNLASLFDRNLMTAAAKLAKSGYNYSSPDQPVSYLEGMVQANERLDYGFEIFLESIAIALGIAHQHQRDMKKMGEEALGRETAHHMKVLAEKSELATSLQARLDEAKSDLHKLQIKQEVEILEGQKRETVLRETINEKNAAIQKLQEKEAEATQELQNKMKQLDNENLLKSNDILENMLQDLKGKHARLKKHLLETVEVLAKEKKDRLNLENVLYLRQNNADWSVGDYRMPKTRATLQQTRTSLNVNRPRNLIDRTPSLQPFPQDTSSSSENLKLSPSLKSVAKLQDGPFGKLQRGPQSKTGRFVATLRKLHENAEQFTQSSLELGLLEKTKDTADQWEKHVSIRLAQLVEKYMKLRRLEDLADSINEKIVNLMSPVCDVLQLFSETSFGGADDLKSFQDDNEKYIKKKTNKLTSQYWRIQYKKKKLLEDKDESMQLMHDATIYRQNVDVLYQKVASTAVALKKRGTTLLAKTATDTKSNMLLRPDFQSGSGKRSTFKLECDTAKLSQHMTEAIVPFNPVRAPDRSSTATETMSVTIEKKVRPDAVYNAKSTLELTPVNEARLSRSSSASTITTQKREIPVIEQPEKKSEATQKFTIIPHIDVQISGPPDQNFVSDIVPVEIKVSRIPIRVEVLSQDDKIHKKNPSEKQMTRLKSVFLAHPNRLLRNQQSVSAPPIESSTTEVPTRNRSAIYHSRPSAFARTNYSRYSQLHRHSSIYAPSFPEQLEDRDADSKAIWKRRETIISSLESSRSLTERKQALHCVREVPQVWEMEVRQDLREIRKAIQNNMRKNSSLTGRKFTTSQFDSSPTDGSLSAETQMKSNEKRRTVRYLGMDESSDSQDIRIDSAGLIALAKRQETIDSKSQSIQYDFSKSTASERKTSPNLSNCSDVPQSRPSTAGSSCNSLFEHVHVQKILSDGSPALEKMSSNYNCERSVKKRPETAKSLEHSKQEKSDKNKPIPRQSSSFR